MNTYIILDLDRTLLNTEMIGLMYEAIIRQKDARLADDLLLAKKEVESRGISFDLHDFVKKSVSHDTQVDFDKHLIEQCSQQSVLNDGATQLLGSLKQRDVAHGILTFGNPGWQKLKLEASGLDYLPALISGERHKSHLIRSWQTVNGDFVLPDELAGHEMGTSQLVSSIVLIDDKAVSFQDLPMNVTGIWYKPSDELMLSQQGEVPGSVQTVRHFDQLRLDELI